MNRQLVLVPQGAEYQAVQRGLAQARQKNLDLKALPMGIGAVQAWLENFSLLASLPDSVLVFGVCGALVPTYGVGQGVVYGKCGNSQGQWHTCQPISEVLDCHKNPKISPQFQNWPTVVALSSDRPLCTVSEKATWAAKTGAAVVDMEGFPLVDFFRRQGIPVAIVRVVSDASDRPIPDLTAAIAADGSLQPLPLLQSFLRQPLPAWHLISGSLRALAVLEKITAQLFV